MSVENISKITRLKPVEEPNKIIGPFFISQRDDIRRYILDPEANYHWFNSLLAETIEERKKIIREKMKTLPRASAISQEAPLIGKKELSADEKRRQERERLLKKFYTNS